MRRFGNEKIYYAVEDSIPASGTISIVAAASGYILSPKKALISSHNAGNFEFDLLCEGTRFCHGHIPANDSKMIRWPDGFTLPPGSGISIYAINNNGCISLYYSKYEV